MTNKKFDIFVDTVEFTGGDRLSSDAHIHRYIWLLTIILACAACSFHLYVVVGEYQEFEVTTLVENYPFKFSFPDVTICATAPFSRAKVAKTGRNGVGLESGQRFWSHLMGYTDRIETIYQSAAADMSWWSLSRKLKEQDIFENILENIYHCKYQHRPCRREDFTTFSSIDRPNCITFSASNKDFLFGEKTQGLHLILSVGDGFLVGSEAGQLHDTDGYEVIVHEKGSLPRVRKDGIMVETGKQVTINLKMKDYTRVNTAVSSCQDIDDIQKSVNRRLQKLQKTKSNIYKSYTENDCLPVKVSADIIDKCYCIPEFLDVPWLWNSTIPFCHDIPHEFYYNDGMDTKGALYFKNKTFNWNKSTEKIKARVQCTASYNAVVYKDANLKYELDNTCPRRCFKSIYETDTQFSTWPKSKDFTMDTLNNNVHNRKSTDMIRKIPISNISEIDNMLSILVYASDLSVDSTVESLAYPLSQLFADFGGNTGLWIGVSLLTVVQVIESFILITLECVRDNKQKKSKKRNKPTVEMELTATSDPIAIADGEFIET